MSKNDDTVTTNEMVMNKPNILETLMYSVFDIFTKCDCYSLTKTPLLTYGGTRDAHRIYVCHDCGKVHYIVEKDY